MPLRDGENVTGRERSATILASHPSISREHTRFIVVGERAEVEDLHSKNGTWLGSRPADGRFPLTGGDEVRLGEVRLLSRGPSAAFSGETKSAL
jgi:pSer/pThr/pTyr-binding forkhead associated (FHA) protein